MSQILTEGDDNRSVAASDFVKLDQADGVPDQQEEQPQFGLDQSFWTVNSESTNNNYENGLKDMKWMMAKIETLQEKMKNLELKAKIRAMEEKAEQSTKYQALEAKFAQMLSIQNEEHHKEMEQLKDGFAKMLSTQSDQHQQQMEQLESKNGKLEEKWTSSVAVQTTTDGAQFHSLEQKLKEAEQRAQTGKNQLEEIIQQKMDKFKEEMDKNGQQAMNKLDFMWSQLIVKSKILANPKGIVWDGSKSTEVSISERGLKGTNTSFLGWKFAIATKGYAISGEHCRKKENSQFPRTIVYYYEVTITSSSFTYSSVGFTDGSKPLADRVGGSPNSYGITGYGADKYSLWLSGTEHKLEFPTGVNADADVVGCGLLLNSKNELAVFFTVDGILLVKQTPIHPTVGRLYPMFFTFFASISVEANFGDNLAAKPFKFDIVNCPGLVFE